MADFVLDTFTGANDTNVDARAGETGATWTKAVGDGSNHLYIQGNALAGIGGGEAIYYASGLPASADYDVVADITFMSDGGNVLIGILGRLSTDGQNYYRVDFNGFNNEVSFVKLVSGVDTTLDTIPWTAASQVLKLEMRGTAIKVYVDDVEVMSAVDADVTDAGRAGLYKFAGVGSSPDFFRINTLTASDPDAPAGRPFFTRLGGQRL